MSYKGTYNWKNYPWITDRQDDLTLQYNPGVNPDVADAQDTNLGLGVGNPAPRLHANRAYMNVDQFNYLAGKLNSVTHIKPFTFNDYYELWPYESGAYIVPKDLYTVEFLRDIEEYASYGCPADNLTEALYGTSGLLKYDLAGKTMISEFMDDSKMRESAVRKADGYRYVTSAPEILFWYKTADGGGGGSTFDATKAYSYYFGFINHTTGWDVKRNPEGFEDLEQWEAVVENFDSTMPPMMPGGSNNLNHPNMSGSWWYHKAKLLQIPIRDESDLPDNYVSEMEKHGADLNVYSHNYSITAKKTTNPIDFPYKNAPAEDGATALHVQKGLVGKFRTDWNSGGYWVGDVSPEVFSVKTSKFDIASTTGFRKPIDYTRGRVSGVDWKSVPEYKASSDFVPVTLTDDGGGAELLDGTDQPCFNSNSSFANRIAKSTKVGYYFTTAGDTINPLSYLHSNAIPTSCTAYDTLDILPEYFRNNYLSNWSTSLFSNDALGAGHEFVWDERFYKYNNYYLARGYGIWTGAVDGSHGDLSNSHIWTNPGGHSYNVRTNIGFTALGGDATTWNAIAGIGSSAGASDKIYQNTKYQSVYAGFMAGYNSGEVLRRPILKARHMLLNKSQSKVDGQRYETYYGFDDNISRVHHNTYELLPFPSQKNLSYGVQDPTGALGQKIDPTNLYDPMHSIGKTYWLKIDDVKNRAKELGFRFEFRRLAVPFKLKEYTFSYGTKPVGFVRQSGDCIVQPDLASIPGNARPYRAFSSHTSSYTPNCGANVTQAWSVDGHFTIDTTGILNGNRIFGPCDEGLGRQNGTYIQAPLDGRPVGGSASASAATTARAEKWPNFVDNNPWGSDLTSQGIGKYAFRNPINSIFADDIDSNNAIYHIDQTATAMASWYNSGYDGANEPLRNGANHIGVTFDDTDGHKVGPLTNGSHWVYADHDDDVETPKSWALTSTLPYDEQAAIADFGGTPPASAKDLFHFKGGGVDSEGSDPDGSFDFNSQGYKPFVGSSKQFVWADNADETTWVRPIGVQERYTYKYDSNISSFDMHVIDFVAEQGQLDDPVNPFRMESVSTWSGNYIWANGGNAVSDPRTPPHPAVLPGWVRAANGGHISATTDIRLQQVNVVRGGTTHTPDTLKVISYLSVLSAYDQIPIFKVTVSDSSYKEWLANVVLNLYPKYYYFQEHSDDEFSKNHAMFTYMEPDLKYSNFPASNYYSETSAEGWIRGKGYEVNTLDIVKRDGQEVDLYNNSAVKSYDLTFGIDSPSYTTAEGRRFAISSWSDTINNTNRMVPVVNNMPSLHTDFWPREQVMGSGAGAENMVFEELTADLGTFLFGTYTSSRKELHLNLQNKLGEENGYRAALQWYLNNAIVIPTGKAGHPTYTLGENTFWNF